ncbi:MAG: tetratricopeptide repeat protein [Sphingomonadales bacterium]|nr:tetratricopeptide repeat protein [Sphingomonadales bacterium]MBD3772720.1 tetratricopeptide repeat protein [Paracoccaceae bacterium]
MGVALLIAAGAIGWRMLPSGGETSASAPAKPDAPPTIEQLEARAQQDPLDAKAWQELGFAYFTAARYADAARAYRQAAEGDPDNAVLWSALGEARVMASESDPLPLEAVTAFEKAIKLDPTDPRARYFLAVKKDLAGDHQGAIDAWAALLKDTPPGAPWEADLQRTIEQAGKINHIDTSAIIAQATAGRPQPPAAPELTAGNAIPGPSQAEIDGASRMRPSEQDDMARGMVESLEAKLKANPANVDGWVMLMRSRMTLGEPDKAARALKDALAANPAQASRLKAEAQVLGVAQ